VSVPNHDWIATPAELERRTEAWCRGGELALDTEFVFERTFRPRLGLIQVAADDGIALLDAVALGDLQPFAAALAAGGVVKVLHAGAGDVGVLRCATGIAPQPLFDTQIAAAFAGLGPALSYGALVSELFGVELSKHETRTDWLRRPLRSEQIRYAVEDVEHLPAAARELERRLATLGRLDWAREDSARLSEVEEIEPRFAWRRLRGIGRLPPAARSVARALAAWREHEAERLDLARPFLMRDETLLALARRTELAADDAAGLPGFEARRHVGHVERWRQALAHALGRAEEFDEDEPRRRNRQEIEERERLERALAAVVAARAAELELPPEVLLSRRQRERLIGRWEPPEPISAGLTGFRRELLGADLDAAARREIGPAAG
jgi:ribonuclease D